MCGIVGIFSHQPVAEELYDSLIHLQHRGQDAAGIVTSQHRLHIKRGLGLVREVFNRHDISALEGSLGIAHTRYPTAGGNNERDVQPILIENPTPMALAHNGNLLNYQVLAEELKQKKQFHATSSTDSEIILHLMADALSSSHTMETEEETFPMLCHAVQSVFKKAKGSYSVVSTILGKGLLAFRDPHGIRPLVMGERVHDNGQIDYIIASETTMFYALGFQSIGDVLPGEVIFIDLTGKLSRHVIETKAFSPCVFEYVYFARPDSMLDGVSVYRSRLRMGQNLARAWKAKHPGILPDIVIPTPFTSNTAALSFAHELGVRYSEGLYKNPFIGRTFIMPEGKDRSRNVRYKLTPQQTEIKNKIVLILDDSIVRGTTSREIVKMVREFHAKSVYFAAACPPIINPCFYGIDMPSHEELIAANHSLEEIRAYLNVDILFYQDIADLVEAVTRRGAHQIKNPCMACLNGHYITGNIDSQKSRELTLARQKSRVT